MIDKIRTIYLSPDGQTCYGHRENIPTRELVEKINEIIDVVNQLEKVYNEEHYIQLDGSIKKEESDTPLTDAFIKVFDSFKEKESK